MKDPIVEEIRYYRDEHSKQFNYDLDAICKDYQTHQTQVGDRLVRRKPNNIANNSLHSDADSATLHQRR